MWLQAIFLCPILNLVASGLSGVPETRKNIPNIGGAAVHLGDLYDGRKDQVMTPKNFYKPSTIQNNLMNSSAAESKNDFYVSESFLDRVNTIDIDAALKLSFMGGLIKISGSARYLHDEHLTENTVETTLKFSSKTLQQQLPYGLELDNRDLCDLVSKEGPEKPTHVVSEVIYGLNAYMQFTKKFRNQTEKKAIEGHLGVVIKAIPAFSIEGEANLNFTEAETEVLRTMRLTWHGDTLIDPPTTFEEAVSVYKNLKGLAENSTKVVMFSLAPITDYCKDKDTILNAISTTNVALVSKMQDDFHRISMKIKDLMTTTVADGYPRYQKVLTTMKLRYDDFKNSLLLEIQKVLPGIRGGGENELKLTKIINDYQTSPYFYEHIDNFLGVRNRELDTIANVLAKAEKSSSITVDFGDTGEGNICIQNHEYSIMYIYRVLPIENIAEDYATTPSGMFDESDKWFYNTSEVAYTGSVLRDFIKFHDSNRDRNDICFLIRLELEDKELAASQLRIQHKKDVITEDFHPPSEITEIFDEVRGWSDYNLTLSFPPNEFLTKIETKIYAVTDGEGPKDSRSRFENLKELDTKVKINLKGLKPNYIYAATFHLWTDYGKGPASEEYLLKTLPSDPPSLVHLISASPNSLSLSWSKPNNIAINVTLDEVYWKITKNQEEISNGNIANGIYPMQVEVNYLQPADNFLFHVKAKSSEIKLTEWRDGLHIKTSIESEWVTVPVSTLPAKISDLNLESTTENSITVTWSPFDKIADGAKFLYYKLKVYREAYKTETNVTSQESRHAITGLAAGEKYQICVMTVTTKGDSPFSDVLSVATNDLNITQLEQLKEALGINIINDNIDKNGAAISNNSNAVAEATKCTAVDWSYSCCTSANPCSFGKGDCDSSDHSTCSGDLRCGTDNCLRDFGFGDSGADCCYLETQIASLKTEIDKNVAAISKNSNVVAKATKCTAVDWSYSCCTSANPCSFGKGDCDENDDSTCSGDLRCGTDNCLRDFGFGDSDADCCYLETVWFDAWRESDFDTSDWTKITYENVRQSTNYQAMDKGTGVFTAPLAGTYQFFIQVWKTSDTEGRVKIVVDGTTVSWIGDFEEPKGATITGTAIIEMQLGQKVWAETKYRLFSDSDRMIHFTGVLITPK